MGFFTKKRPSPQAAKAKGSKNLAKRNKRDRKAADRHEDKKK